MTTEISCNQAPDGYVHLVPDQHSSAYDVRFWTPVAMGTKLYSGQKLNRAILAAFERGYQTALRDNGIECDRAGVSE